MCKETSVRCGFLMASTIFLATWTIGCSSEHPAEPTLDGTAEKTVLMAEHFLVVYGGTGEEFAAAVEAAGGTVERVHPEIRMAKVTGLTDEQAAQLAGQGGIEAALRDVWASWAPGIEGLAVEELPEASQKTLSPDPTNAFYFPCQWNMTQVAVPTAWSQGFFGNPSVKVAVLDTGVDPFHQDLVGRIDEAQSTSMLSYSPCGAVDKDTFLDRHYHGTFVSGIITTNGIGVAGVAPAAQVVGVKVLRCDNFGSFADIIAGIIYAANLPDVHVINMSIQAHFPKSFFDGLGGYYLQLHNEAIDYAVAQGKIVVVAAGNFAINLDKDRDGVELPAQAGNAVGIWAGDIDGDLASYSNYGRSGTWVGAGGGDSDDLDSPLIPLPGCLFSNVAFQDGIASPCASTTLIPGLAPCATGNRYLVNGTGTSFASPLVAGVVALVDGAAGGAIGPQQLREMLNETADDIGKKGNDPFFSHGRVNASRAVLWQQTP